MGAAGSGVASAAGVGVGDGEAGRELTGIPRISARAAGELVALLLDMRCF